MKTFEYLYALQFKTSNNFKANLDKLKDLIDRTKENSIIVAPEVSLTNFYYDDMDKASDFGTTAKNELLKLSNNRLIAITLIEKDNSKYLNNLVVFYNNKIIYSQPKVKLFELGGEAKWFNRGKLDDIKFFKANNVTFAALICFELRFIDVWQKIQGADIILLPAMWGLARKEAFETLTKSLATINQSYLIASNSSNQDMASSSAIFDPFGKTLTIDDNQEILEASFKPNRIKKMRNYLDIGITSIF